MGVTGVLSIVLLSTLCCPSSFMELKLRSLLLSLALDFAAGLSALSMNPFNIWLWLTLSFFLRHDDCMVLAERKAWPLSSVTYTRIWSDSWMRCTSLFKREESRV